MLQPEAIKVCPECGSSNIIHDNVRGDVFCGSCGLVLSEQRIDHGPDRRLLPGDDMEVAHTGAPMTVMLHDRGLSTEIGMTSQGINPANLRHLYSLRKWQKRSLFRTSAERNLMAGLRDISRMAAQLGLPPSVKETAAIVHRRAVEKRLIVGRSTVGIATASVYAACRMCGVPRTLEEITEVSQIKDLSSHGRREIARSYRVLARELHLELETPTPFSFVSRLASELGLSNKVISRVYDILKLASERNISVGKSPVSITAAAIYISSLENGEKRKQKDIAKVAGITEVTVRNRYKELVKKLNITLPEP